MHPLSRILLVLWISSLAIILQNPLFLFALLIFSLLWSSLLSLPKLISLLSSLKVLLPLILAVFLSQILFRRGGNMLLKITFLAIYSDGVFFALQVCFRLLILLVSATILSSLSYAELRLSLRYLPEEFSFMISYVLHLLPQLRQQIQVALFSLRNRGIQISRLKYRDRLVIYKTLSLTILAGLIHTSTMQAAQLELRGFRRQGKKTYLYHRKLTLMDGGLVIVLIGLSFLLGFLFPAAGLH